LYGKTEQETKDIIASVRDFSQIDKYFDMPISTYSSGMKGRVGFGLSLSFDFDYMIIDETLSVGDASFKEKAKKALREKIKTCHVLLVSHDMQTLRDICQSGLLVDEGELFYYEDINEAISHYNKINKAGK
jgi:capsular polysaccharide transport system ATP-binding protein